MAMILCAFTQYLPPSQFEAVSYVGMLFPVFLVLTICFIPFWIIVTKWKLSAVSVVGMLICSSSIRAYCPLNLQAEIPTDAIKIVSYNIMNMGDDALDNFDSCVTIQYLKSQNADIVCLQESSSVIDDVAEYLRDVYPYSLVSRDNNTIVSCLSKHPVVSAERIDYTSLANCSYAYRIALDRGEGRSDTILVVNNHLEGYHLEDEDKSDYKTIVKNIEDEDNEDRYLSLTAKLNAANAIRGNQADTVAMYVDHQPEKYKIVCGDFNDNPISYTHYRLTRTLNDAYTRSGNGVGFSYNRYGMYFRIDNILVSPNITACVTRIDSYSKISDHYPIVSWLKLQ